MSFRIGALAWLAAIMRANTGPVRQDDVNNNAQAEAFKLIPGAHPAWGVMRLGDFSTAASVVTITGQDQYTSQFGSLISGGLLPPSAPLSRPTSTLTYTMPGVVVVVPTSLFYPTYTQTAVSITTSATTVVGAVYDDQHTVIDGQGMDQYLSNHPGASLSYSGADAGAVSTEVVISTVVVPEPTVQPPPKATPATATRTKTRHSTHYRTVTGPTHFRTVISQPSPSSPAGIKNDDAADEDPDTQSEMEEGVSIVVPANETAGDAAEVANRIPVQAPDQVSARVPAEVPAAEAAHVLKESKNKQHADQAAWSDAKKDPWKFEE